MLSPKRATILTPRWRTLINVCGAILQVTLPACKDVNVNHDWVELLYSDYARVVRLGKSR